MSAAIEAPKSTEKARLDEVVGRLREGSKSWVKLPLPERIGVARRMLDGFLKVAQRSVEASCMAKGVALGSPQEGEEWLAGPYATCRILRFTVEALEQIARNGTTTIGRTGRTLDGKLKVANYPLNLQDKVMFGGLVAETVFEAGVDEKEMHELRAGFYKKPSHEGK
ncbi:MAG: aldehyde dehydrogenase, partial [Deltaproteobacteria bacterium]|nr:aldehyde dehydrogenase [Deltaproteobacteria bacterium]